MQRNKRHCHGCGRYTSAAELCECRKAAQIRDGKARQDLAVCMSMFVADMDHRARRVAEVACMEGV